MNYCFNIKNADISADKNKNSQNSSILQMKMYYNCSVLCSCWQVIFYRNLSALKFGVRTVHASTSAVYDAFWPVCLLSKVFYLCHIYESAREKGCLKDMEHLNDISRCWDWQRRQRLSVLSSGFWQGQDLWIHTFCLNTSEYTHFVKDLWIHTFC